MTAIVAGGVLVIEDQWLEPDPEELAGDEMAVVEDDAREPSEYLSVSARCIPWLELDSGVCVTTGFDEVLGCTFDARLNEKRMLAKLRSFIAGSGWWLALQHEVAQHDLVVSRPQLLRELRSLSINDAARRAIERACTGGSP